MTTHPGLAGRMGARRAVIPHVDDLGATHGANQAFLQLAAAGQVTCGSVMVPGPWFPEIAAAAIADPALDLGVHLTLTSEWPGLRWAPVSTCSRASGLLDDDGYFPRDVAALRRQLVPEAAEAELRAQVERALAAGLRPTHLDAHMAAAMLPELLGAHVRLARDYGLWPVLPRSIGWAPDPAAYAAAVVALDMAGLPVADHCRGTLPVPAGALAEGWRAVIDALPDGVTHLALHATAPGEFAATAPDHAEWRFAEYAWLAGGGLARMLAEADVAVLGCRAMQALWNGGGATIRPALPGDVPAIRDVVHDAYAHYVPRLGRQPGPMLDEYAAQVAAGHAWVLEDAGRIDGVAVLEPAGDALLLENVAVRRVAQGRGHGRALIAFAEAETLRRGLGVLRLYTNALMQENQVLYRRLGFIETGRTHEAGHYRVYMAKALAQYRPPG